MAMNSKTTKQAVQNIAAADEAEDEARQARADHVNSQPIGDPDDNDPNDPSKLSLNAKANKNNRPTSTYKQFVNKVYNS